MTAPRRRRPVSGFTLIEVMAVIGLVSVVLLVAIDFYLDLSRATRGTADTTRQTRRAVAILDRISRDLEGSFLVRKPAETDPLEWPYLFLAESREAAGAGADHVKLVRQGHRPRATDLAESDLEAVAWMLGETEEGEPALYRWSAPRLPEALDRDFPSPRDEGVLLVAEGIRSFGVRLLSEDGEWKSEWDSSSLVDSSRLPEAAKITLSFADELRGAPGGAEDAEPRAYETQVLLPLRPLDLEALMAPGGVAGFVAQGGRLGENGEVEEGEPGGGDDGGDGDGVFGNADPENCITVRECLARHPEAVAAYRQRFGTDYARMVGSILDECFVAMEPIMQQVGLFSQDLNVNISDCLR